MSFLLRFCLGLVVLLPSLAHAARLGIPGNGAKLSGVSVISGWKCEAEGDLTIVFNDDGNHIPLLYGTERTDVRADGQCLENDHDNVGFVAIWNWGNLGDGEHTAVAYDDGVKFAESTFEVVTFGTEFLTGVSGECRVPDFPMPGESTLFEWNQATQHLEAVSLAAACMEELTLESGEICSSSISLTTPLGDISLSFTFSVDADGQGCISGGTPVDGCYPDSLPAELDGVGISIMKNTDGSWTIESFPAVDLELPTGDLGACAEGLTVGPGAMCSGSVKLGEQEIGYTFSVNVDGQGCVDLDIAIDLDCFDTAEAFETLLSSFQITGPALTKNDDGSWTIDSIPTDL